MSTARGGHHLEGRRLQSLRQNGVWKYQLTISEDNMVEVDGKHGSDPGGGQRLCDAVLSWFPDEPGASVWPATCGATFRRRRR